LPALAHAIIIFDRQHGHSKSSQDCTGNLAPRSINGSLRRCGRSPPAVFPSKAASIRFIATPVAPGTKRIAEQAPSWNGSHGRFDVARIDHGLLYGAKDGI
jgi:hypothetical protein